MLLRLLIPLVFAAASPSDPPAFALLTLRGREVSRIDQFPLRASERGAEEAKQELAPLVAADPSLVGLTTPESVARVWSSEGGFGAAEQGVVENILGELRTVGAPLPRDPARR